MLRATAQEVHFASPSDAIDVGHRHGAPALHAGRQPDRARERDPRLRTGAVGRPDRLRRGSRAPRARSARRTGSTSTPTSWSKTLEVGERQRIEIIKVLYRGAKILILDEPTAVLVPQEVEALFDNLRELKAKRLDDPLHRPQAARGARDRRHDHRAPPGQDGGHGQAGGRDARRPRRADGRQRAPDARHHRVDRHRPRSRSSVRGPDDLRRTAGRSVENVSLTIHRGEIVGIAGVEGNGQAELIGAIIGTEHPMTGHDHARSATTSRAGRCASAARPASATCPRTATTEGLLLNSPLWENAALGHQTQRPYSKGWWIDRKGVARTHRGDPRGVRRQDPERRRRRLRAVGRQSAEADHRSRDDVAIRRC